MKRRPVPESNADPARAGVAAVPAGRATAQLVLFIAAMGTVSAASAVLGLAMRLVPARAEPPRP